MRLDDARVAVKCARHHIQDDRNEHNMRLIAREIHAWAQCNHDNVLQLVGLTEHRGKLAMVSPWMENGNLREYLAKNPHVNRLDLCLQITRGLAYLHQRDMVHGDLKGANVLVSDTGTAKLADFGNTKLKEQSLQLTTRTSPVYSLRWAAPEILESSPCSIPADLYALGMETVTGDVPYADKTDLAIPVEVLVHRRPPTRNDEQIKARCDKDQLWRLMTDCWNRTSLSRPQAIEVEKRLNSLMGVIERKLVILGDGGCGKTSLLIVFAMGIFPEMYVPTVFENYVAEVEIDGRHVELELWDTAGQEEYNRLRPLSYPDAHVILLCFAIDSPSSFNNVQEKWIFELMHYCSGVPVILIGCKKDLRFDPETNRALSREGQLPVTPEAGVQMAQNIGAHHYLECSAKADEGVREVFWYATQMVLLRKGRKKHAKCLVL
ncbi:GTP-binding protein Rho1 [Ceratobasidium sp. 394]|nr:GTP-binding protein Rho1 [Ceratobasidium sp. 394]